MKISLIIGLLIIVSCIIIYIILYRSNIECYNNIDTVDKEPMYCLMVTGKSKCRHLFARQSIQNFLQQDYPNKKLVILNHGDYKLLNETIPNVHEYMIVKTKDISLGDLRNITLNLVPPESYWTIWDDDDYRSPNYLSYMYTTLKNLNVDVLGFNTRYEFNYKTNLFWQVYWKRGFATCLCKKDGRFKYLNKDTMEDMNIFTDYITLGHKVAIVDNNPSMYIRLVHGDNTSMFINYNKNNISKQNTLNYKESNVLNESKYMNFMLDYYKEGLQCMHHF